MGWGLSNHTDEITNLHFKTNSPYFKIGCDYNFVKNWRSGNRVFAGVRYAFTSFKYDLDGPPITDPIWGGTTPFAFSNVSSNMHWGEIVFGLEAKIWGIFHLGWSVRYKMRISQKETSLGQAWYVPGYGKNDSHALGGTFNVIFDI